jgi:superfamily II RNA helicase
MKTVQVLINLVLTITIIHAFINQCKLPLSNQQCHRWPRHDDVGKVSSALQALVGFGKPEEQRPAIIKGAAIKKKYKGAKSEDVTTVKEDIDSLERQLAQKFWSKNIDEDSDDEELMKDKKIRKDKHKKNFYFESQLALKPKSGKSKENKEEDEYEGSGDEDDGPFLRKLEDMKMEADDKFIKNRTKSADSLAEYRLRKPPKPNPAIAIRLVNKAAKDAIDQIKRKAEKKELNKHSFVPFDFSLVNDAESSQQIFSNTATSFQDIGITNNQVLQNLDKMRIFNPTKIQELSVPLLSSGQSLVLHAQTGSGKTLSYLLPLLNLVDPSRKKVSNMAK